ncbi:uncharacterized protein EV420DRAFT_1478662 [Desarmillaria tabescens]|uniref:Uncharacterized protein n=1 Tax=Armillaria tabescens TaxID=1929756 RepID=A0AA39KG27_ARMTA|nr:uncharacterized protein EV420DRAFT_1478662 [Desarmillaria tabescens]KAK0460133.1 hypothetical protein EV420DRAFT_1478662 [Desarmillaria tabescens]
MVWKTGCRYTIALSSCSLNPSFSTVGVILFVVLVVRTEWMHYYLELVAETIGSGVGGVRTVRMNKGLAANISNKWQGGLGKKEDVVVDLIYPFSNYQNIALAKPPLVAVPSK